MSLLRRLNDFLLAVFSPAFLYVPDDPSSNLFVILLPRAPRLSCNSGVAVLIAVKNWDFNSILIFSSWLDIWEFNSSLIALTRSTVVSLFSLLLLLSRDLKSSPDVFLLSSDQFDQSQLVHFIAH